MPLCGDCKAPTCWTERTKLEKWLIPSLIIIGALVLALAFTCFYLAGWFTKSKTETPAINEENKKSDFQKKSETVSSKDGNVCTTPSCITAAKTMLEYIDPTVSPCENFYDFACGNFLKNKIIPEDRPYIDMTTPLEDNLAEQLKNALEEPIQKGEPKAFKLMKNFYKACMDTNAIEKDGLNTIRSILKEVGGWPILEGDNWVESKFDWKELSYKLQNIGFTESPLFQLYVAPDFRDSTRYVLVVTDDVSSVSAAFRKRLWTDDEVRKAFFQYMMDAAVLLGADKNKSVKEIKDMFELHIKLEDLREEKEGPTEFMSVDELQHKVPSISWVEYINTLLAPHVKVTGDDTILVIKPDYIKEVLSLIPTISKRTLANCMMWNVVENSITYSTKALIEAELKYTSIRSGVATQPARWISCVTNCKGSPGSIETVSLWIGLGALYVRKYFTNKTKQDVQAMILNIHHSYLDTMKNLDWMDDKTKKNALDKLKATAMDTAYPDEFLDDKKLEEFFGDLDLDENNNYLKLHLKLYQFDIGYHYRCLRKRVDKNYWIDRGMRVIIQPNAAYDVRTNQIRIPAAILQPRMFDTTRPHYLNYGAIGTIIGHEFTHGFDTFGSKRDKDGNEVDWWTPESKNLFLKKAQCFVEQFNKFVLPDINLPVNGELTLVENLADSGGLYTSYKAYQELIKKQGCDKTLPGLNYTQNQLFWIAAVNYDWCTKMRPAHQQAILPHNNHAPERFRTIGLLRNNLDFSKDFRCSSRSKMNPRHKCKLW